MRFQSSASCATASTLSAGGQIADNLGELYDYMCRRLLKATTENRVEMLDEVSKLLHEIRGAWLAIPPRRAPDEPLRSPMA